MKRYVAVALVLALAAPLLLLGCGKDNPVKPPDDPQPFVYPDQSTPKNAVMRMAAALANRDSAMTDSVYANDYVGTSVDLTDPSPATYEFTESDEIGFVGALARSSSLVYLNVNFGPHETWNQTHYGSDPPGWITVQIPNFRMDLTDGMIGEFGVRSYGLGETWIFEFTLRPTPDDTSPTDTTWTIVRWVESRSQN